MSPTQSNHTIPTFSWVNLIDRGIDRTGSLVIAGAATVSLVATLGLIAYVVILGICMGSSSTTKWASFRLSFMRTTFGPLFLNLAIADLIQALGLMHNYFALDLASNNSELLCISQGFMVQLGDVASALMTLLISIETFVILSKSPAPRSGSLWAAAIIWLMCISFSFKGLLTPPIIDYSSLGTWTGGWCWIAFESQGYRVMFHHFWLWATAIVSTILYGSLYWRIRGHYKGEGHVLQRSSIIIPAPQSPTERSLSSIRSRASSLRRVAWTMLVYPITFVILSIPISIISILRIEDFLNLARRNLFLTIFGSLFGLRGAINVLVYGMTRNVFFLRTPPPSMRSDDTFVPPSPSGSKHTLRLSFQSDLIKPTPEPSSDHHSIHVPKVQVIYPASSVEDITPSNQRVTDLINERPQHD
ncbi:hypothetical protein CROQUDRAFT_133853 [Cronartium quercuum f. sp. fusiforme G11]|uniref:G-protein coupled receptors family 1 profile domain-containing protein n=1 Tax=Cronartium quercuum f. sp. fusiforme G11 TaxID=708437 RepID=A0A9P6TB21_9BASI|nr:hypothetical protein CROQUDRAFT_133853 [Cronartium quercuum f. sp. fusiforme G11]